MTKTEEVMWKTIVKVSFRFLCSLFFFGRRRLKGRSERTEIARPEKGTTRGEGKRRNKKKRVNPHAQMFGSRWIWGSYSHRRDLVQPRTNPRKFGGILSLELSLFIPFSPWVLRLQCQGEGSQKCRNVPINV